MDSNVQMLLFTLVALTQLFQNWLIIQQKTRIKELEQFRDALIHSITKAIEEENDGTEE